MSEMWQAGAFLVASCLLTAFTVAGTGFLLARQLPGKIRRQVAMLDDLVGEFDQARRRTETRMAELELEWADAFEKLQQIAETIETRRRKAQALEQKLGKHERNGEAAPADDFQAARQRLMAGGFGRGVR